MADADLPRTRDEDWRVWMAAAQAGDRAAYRRLLLDVAPYVRAIAARMSRDPAEIEDATQDVLIAVHAARASYDPRRPFRPWLAGIARHRLVDRLRVARRTSEQETPLTTAHEQIAAPSASGAGEHGLRHAMAQLPAVQRLAIQRLKLEEKTLRVVAAETGLSIGALKAATWRGLRRLRQLLTDEQPA